MWRAFVLRAAWALILVSSSAVHAAGTYFQRMGVLGRQAITLTVGGSGRMDARCMDSSGENSAPPKPDNQFEKVLHGAPGSATVRKSSGESLPLEEALDDGWLEIRGENDAAQQRRFEAKRTAFAQSEQKFQQMYQEMAEDAGPLKFDLLRTTSKRLKEQAMALVAQDRRRYDEIVLINTSGAELTISVDEPIVLGGVHHEPFPFDAVRHLDPDQNKTWDALGARTRNLGEDIKQMQLQLRSLGHDLDTSGTWNDATRAAARRLAGADEITIDALQDAIKRNIDDLQQQLLLLGYTVKLTSSYDEATRDAVLAFQKKQGIRASGRLDARTWRALQTQHAAAADWLSAAIGYSPGLSARASFSDLLRSVELSPTLALSEPTKASIVERLKLPFDDLRPKLKRLGYEVPASNDVLEWRAMASQFQSEHEIPDVRAGVFDESTRTVVDEIFAATEQIRVGNTADMYTLDPEVVKLGELAGARYTVLLSVPRSVANQLRIHINRIVGREVMRARPGDGDYVDLLLVDSRGGSLEDSVASILELDRIGTGLAMGNGVAIRHVGLGDRDALVTASSELKFHVAANAANEVMRKARELTGQAPSDGISQQLISEVIGDATFVVAVGSGLDQVHIEQLVKVPVIRAADLSRTPEQVVSLAREALARPMEPSHTVAFTALPKTDRERDQLLAEEDLRGLSEDDVERLKRLWLQEPRAVEKYLRSVGIRSTRRLDHRLADARDLIVIAAHSNGTDLYAPGKKELRRISAAEWAKYKGQFTRNRPTVLLLACGTGNLDREIPTLATELLQLGAGAVIAPLDMIDLRDAVAYLRRVIEQPDGSSLVARVMRAQEGGLEFGGQMRLIVFQRTSDGSIQVANMVAGRVAN